MTRGQIDHIRKTVRTILWASGLLALTLSASMAQAAWPENLAPKAKVSATSEFDANYTAQFAVDEQLPEAGSQNDSRQAWAIDRAKSGPQAEFTLAWDQPVEVAEIVYFGRTAQVLYQCWKDYEVYLDEDTTPVAKGAFEMAHGPQRIAIEKRSVRKIRLKFLNSHGPHNPGASEIAVFSVSPSEEQLDSFPEMPAPAGPPWVEPAALPPFAENPFQRQVEEQAALLASDKAEVRCVALRNLSQMRAYEAADRVAGLLSDPRAKVRCEAAMNLGRTGNRNHLIALLKSMYDEDWSVRQAAWISLGNLTGQEFPFDSMGSPEKRKQQAVVWNQWIASLNPHDLAKDYAADAPWLAKERLARAMGVIGERESAVPVLIEALRPYVKRASNDRHERLFLQAGIRSLGRLGGDKARELLISLLENPQWAVYAADALGDLGDEESAMALLTVLPDYAYRLDRAARLPGMPNGNGHDMVNKRDPNDYDFGGGGKIWTPRTAYAILFALSRIDFSHPDTIAKLRKISPRIISNMPLDYDGVCAYDIEPWQPISAWLLDRAGVRQAVVDAAFWSLGLDRKVPSNLPYRKELVKAAKGLADKTDALLTPFAAKIILSCCRAEEDIPLVIELLTHPSLWVRINAAKTLICLDAKQAAGPISRLLEEAPDDADYGYFSYYGEPDLDRLSTRGHEEYNDPCPRYKEAFLRALGRLGDQQSVPLLVRYLNNDRNAMEIQHAAARALVDLGTPSALAALRQAEVSHPFHNIRLLARESLQQQGIRREPRTTQEKLAPVKVTAKSEGPIPAIVFIKAPKIPPNAGWMFSATMQAYNQTDEGPTYRVGSNIYRLEPPEPSGKVTPLTHFTDGYVADLRVSYDGRKILFSRCEGENEPWWHLFEMNVDGSGIRQLTDGPYHDVQPNFMPDGRIVFCTSRVGARDEYHGYLSTAVAVMNADGTDIHCIGFNCARDSEPVVNTDGRILFIRLEGFYSLPKLEFVLESCLPDGTDHQVLYGPERREFWIKNISPKGSGTAYTPEYIRHRQLCITQPQPLDGKTFLINSFCGPMIVGPGRYQDRILREDDKIAVTSPYPVDQDTLLCSAGERPAELIGNHHDYFWAPVDHGLYWMDIASGDLTLIYNDPETSELEARPLAPRPVPPVLASSPSTRQESYTGRLFCSSIYNTQHQDVKDRGRYIRIVEGLPMVARHNTGINGGQGWMNHGGLTARILGAVPVAPDGSFSLELPADRLFHIQVLDADGYVVGNELNWHYVRPGESKGCVGCHEKPDTVPKDHGSFPLAAQLRPVSCLPSGGEMLYRAKNWCKWVNDENEERKRTVNALNLMGRL